MMIFKKYLPRRTFLRGAGATIALPMLDAMFPALAQTKLNPQVPRRFSIVYAPNGMHMERWTPTEEGKDFKLSPLLEPLAPYREQLQVITGLSNLAGDPLPGEGELAPHERAGGVFLTGVHPLREGQTGVSIDQIMARHLGQQTQLASLELGLHSKDIVGNCEKGWSCAYMSTLSWRTPTTPLPIEYRPREVFERLFGDSVSTAPEARLSRIIKDKSILDSVTDAASQMLARLGHGDKSRLTEYLDSMRDVERRIQMAEQQSSREIPAVARPDGGVPGSFEQHIRIMFDLQVLAFQTDMTRVITFMMGHAQSNRTFGEIGIPDVHHSLSHHRNDPEKLEKIYRINLYHTQLVTYYLDKLKNTADVDGSLLDNMIIMLGSDMSDGNAHSLHNLPVALIGGGSGQLQGSRHVRYPLDTPMANLYLSLLTKLDIPVDNFGDANGQLDLLSGV